MQRMVGLFEAVRMSYHFRWLSSSRANECSAEEQHDRAGGEDGQGRQRRQPPERPHPHALRVSLVTFSNALHGITAVPPCFLRTYTRSLPRFDVLCVLLPRCHAAGSARCINMHMRGRVFRCLGRLLFRPRHHPWNSPDREYVYGCSRYCSSLRLLSV